MPTAPKPVALQTGKIGKDKRQEKKDAEVSLGEIKYTVTPAVKADPEAYRKWREITNLYKKANIKFVSSSDIGTMSRYCLVYSEYLDLVAKRREISRIEPPEDLYNAEMVDCAIEEFGQKRAAALWDFMQYIISIDGVMKIDKAINSKAKTLLDLENTLFLNPLAKIRSVPVQKVKKPDEAADDGFDV